MQTSIKAEEKSTGKNYLVSALVAAVSLVIWQNFTDAIPFSTFEFWKVKGTVGQWFASSWPCFAWAAGITMILHILGRNRITRALTPDEVLAAGFIRSLFAGVTEEIAFRWLIYLNAIVWAKVFNWLFFGFAGFGIPEWLFLNVFGPVANAFTFGQLKPFLFSEHGWAAGAAILGANGFFRDGHKYQGLFGWLNSWFMGIFLFWMMFTYGLLAAILIHFLYDLLIYLVISIAMRLDSP